ncbi:hypothetical protein COOONC_21676 [Cooperia oncophora]
MILATCLFMAGSFWYKKPPPKENIFAEVSRVMARAIANKFHSKTKKEHWLDNYMDTHVCESDPKAAKILAFEKWRFQKSFIDDIKSLLRVLIMFLPVPMFWALYDQQGSIWLIQASAKRATFEVFKWTAASLQMYFYFLIKYRH